MKKQEIQMNVKNNGITLIVLVITIIVLLILAGVTIVALTGDNGIINNSKTAREETEISNEIEIVNNATTQAMGSDKYGNIEKSELEKQLDKIVEGETEVSDIGEEFEVTFINSKRYYIVDKDGNVSEAQKIVEDKSPGDITKDENGNDIEEGKPYEIWCIEDLVAFSNMVNGEGIIIKDGKPVEVDTYTTFSNNTVELKRNLNFKSKYSYANSERTDFGDINGDENDGNTLINEMTTGTGFNPIGIWTIVSGLNRGFAGVFEGNNNEILNLYQSGLFRNIVENATIKDITVYGTSRKTNSFGLVQEVRGKNVNIINCKNYIDVISTDRAGGIVTYNNASSLNVMNCINYGNIQGNGSGVGGLIGYSNRW